MYASRVAVLAAMSLAGAFSFGAPEQQGFKVEPDARGVWAFVSPDGERFLSIGVNNISPKPYNPRPGTKYYDAAKLQFSGDVARWADWCRDLLLENGFNTAGCWSHPAIPTVKDSKGRLYRTQILYVCGYENDRPLRALEPDFEKTVLENTRKSMLEAPDRSALLGVFLDNEMAWWGKSGWEPNPTYTLLDVALEEPATNPAHKAAIDFLRSRHSSPEALAKAYEKPEGSLRAWEKLDGAFLRTANAKPAIDDRTAFTAMVAQKFYSRAAGVVRKELPGVLILGTRFAGSAPDAVIEECGKVSDVMSVNFYNHQPAADPRALARFWILGKKPLLITEWSFRARQNQSGDPNTRGAGAVLETQAQRADAYSKTATDYLSWPMVIGMHWFEFADQSPQGRFDGEDSNYGIVDIENKPYPELLAAMKATHRSIPGIRASITRTAPTEMPAAPRVSYSPGQHPERPASLDLLTHPVRDPETWAAPDAGAGWSRRADSLVVAYDAGNQWGVGLNLYGPASCKVAGAPENTVDLDGYSFAVIELKAPKGLQMAFHIIEAGADFPGKPNYNTGTSADGEAFHSDSFFGTGEPQTVRIDLANLEKQSGYGNQNGNSRLDAGAIRTFGLQMQGTPRKGEVVIYSFKLVK